MYANIFSHAPAPNNGVFTPTEMDNKFVSQEIDGVDAISYFSGRGENDLLPWLEQQGDNLICVNVEGHGVEKGSWSNRNNGTIALHGSAGYSIAFTLPLLNWSDNGLINPEITSIWSEKKE